MARPPINGTITTATNHGLDDRMPDTLVSSAANDTINGFGGDDTLLGGGGHDIIRGGFGSDWINGGTGWDTLTGGVGNDTFAFLKHDSGPNYWQADVITDFNAAEGDRIGLFNSNFHMTSGSQYLEATIGNTGTHEGNYNLALSFAKGHMGDGVQAIFVTDHKDGYLFADMDGNGLVDTGIELKGLDSRSDFDWHNLIV